MNDVPNDRSLGKAVRDTTASVPLVIASIMYDVIAANSKLPNRSGSLCFSQVLWISLLSAFVNLTNSVLFPL